VHSPRKYGKGLWIDADGIVRVDSTTDMLPRHNFHESEGEGMTEILLDNFLKALTLAGITLMRFMLQTGAGN
jgi:hypothetical protein